MAKDLSALNQYPHTATSSSVTGAEVLTIDAARATAVSVYIDAADGGTVTTGVSGAAVPVAGQAWATVWVAAAPTTQRGTTVSVTPTTGSTDIHWRVL